MKLEEHHKALGITIDQSLYCAIDPETSVRIMHKNLTDRLISLSNNKESFEEASEEWCKILKKDDNTDKTLCLCGSELLHVYHVINSKNNNVCRIGCVCIKRLPNGDLTIKRFNEYQKTKKKIVEKIDTFVRDVKIGQHLCICCRKKALSQEWYMPMCSMCNLLEKSYRNRFKEVMRHTYFVKECTMCKKEIPRTGADKCLKCIKEHNERIREKKINKDCKTCTNRIPKEGPHSCQKCIDTKECRTCKVRYDPKEIKFDNCGPCRRAYVRNNPDKYSKTKEAPKGL